MTMLSLSNGDTATKARQALLETISDRERELSRIRLAADKIIEEEQRESTKQLQALQSEISQYQRLLQEKDGDIQSLHSQMEK
jgi:phage host-nuclease inhibitor protein Gam